MKTMSLMYELRMLTKQQANQVIAQYSCLIGHCISF